jgi:hypothetical protein
MLMQATTESAEAQWEVSEWQRLMLTIVACHRIFNVRWPRQVSLLEELARKPFVSNTEDLQKWWLIVESATLLGHVAWRQVAEGIVSLTDRWETWSILNPRELRKLGESLDKHGLERFGADKEGVTKHYLLMLASLQGTTHKPPKRTAHVAFGDVLDETAISSSISAEAEKEAEAEAAFGAWKPKGGPKGGGKGGKDSGCFNCGGKDHWSRECPLPDKRNAAHYGGQDKGKGKGKSTTLCRQFAKDGKCSYGENCIFVHGQAAAAVGKPKRKKALLAALNVIAQAIGEDDEKEEGDADEQGNVNAPSPTKQ